MDYEVQTLEEIRTFLYDDASEEEPSGFDPKDKKHAIKRKRNFHKRCDNKPWKMKKIKKRKTRCQERIRVAKKRERAAMKEFRLETSEI